MSGRIAVGVSGAGSNLRALHASAARGELDGAVVLVFADRACPALEWAAEQGIDTALVPDGDDGTLAEALAGAGADLVVLAGYMRVVGPTVLAAFPNRILNTHPSLLPSFAGAHAVADALAHGAAVTGCTVHLVDETIDGGPIVAQEAVPILPGDDVATLHARIQAVEHRLLPRSAGLLIAGALSLADDGRHVTIDLDRADAAVPRPRRALLSVSDKSGLVELGRGLVARGFELVSTGGTARALRDADLPVTDVAAVTGFPEMLDGRVKTLHPRVHGGVLADRRLPDHRRQLIAAAIAPFELVVVNLYPFAAALERPGITVDELIEEIDIGGPSMVRAAAKNHANVAVVVTPGRYEAILAGLDAPGRPVRSAATGPRARGVRAHRRVRRADRRRVARAIRGGRTRAPARTGHARRRGPVSADADGGAREGRDPALRREPAPARGALPAAGDEPLGRAVRRGPDAAPGQDPVVQQRARCGRGGRARTRAPRARRRDRQAHESVRRRRTVLARRGVDGVARSRPDQRVRWRRGPDPARDGRGRRAAGVDLPGDRRRAGVRTGRPRGAGPEAEPAGARRRGPRRRRAVRDRRPRPGRSGPPAGRTWSARPIPRATIRRRGRRSRVAPRPTTSCSIWTWPGAWSAA